ncbi:hypothetical protein [Micromonospora narathiwatensis]|uniref:Uncharacterized protein n=1 Tax=Micromonospora narathiwatensis TaxID=299146 RepID=A0A1A8ZVU2_9ACTN|nr:hypothetical protein [Micromonospora narathiwatensis]SBT47993.1 hypothetical protein GA0070621_3053 [Micromonospora narathiwatensis]
MSGIDEPVDRTGGELDGFRIGHVPDGVGPEMSDSAGEWDEIAVATRVWERRVDGGYRVDLRVHVLRGDRLCDLAALHDFLADWHERDAAEWEMDDFSHPDGPGLICESEAFWLVEPGVAVAVLLDPEHPEAGALPAVAAAVTRTPT